MVTPPKSFAKLAKSIYGRDLAKYLAENILSLDSLEGIDFKNEKQSAIEGLGRKLAAEKLKDILSTLLSGKEEGIIKDDREDEFSLTIKDKE